MPRLDDLLARNLGCSRGQVRALLADGRITLADGGPPDARRNVPPDQLPIEARFDDELIPLHDAYHLVLNKPRGCVTALRDDRHPTAYELLEGAPLFSELRAVGRLDLETTGLLIWTTEGALVQRLTHPKRAVPRTYQAALARDFDPLPPGGELLLEDGHRPHIAELRRLSPDEGHPSLDRPDDTALLAQITILGGAYHEVRRIFAALGSHVLGLCRTRFGRLLLPADLPLGSHRQIQPGDV